MDDFITKTDDDMMHCMQPTWELPTDFPEGLLKKNTLRSDRVYDEYVL